ncbi:CsgG/HfaB family protein [Paraglaciecola sp. L3A3]|uniref:CsgG/HfaB family protein n=1 Tax=Paraglaciecola sp. L3A3 TaxID=2686358 RepID=UPI0018EECCAF|nr:CsgG/HfaB family protein [Paraglaciecola sp. L3A3]
MYQPHSGMKQIATTDHRSSIKKPITKFIVVTLLSTLVSSCMSTIPQMGDTDGNTITGGAGGGNAEGNNSSLEQCDQTLGTLTVFEDTKQAWWRTYRSRYPKLGSTLPVIRLMIQQSNCFVIVERGAAMSSMNRERQLMQSGQLRSGSNIGGGQMVAADYTLSPSIQFSAEGTKGLQAAGGALLGGLGSLIGGGVKKNEASTTLLLIDNRSGVQVSAAVGSAGNWDFNLFNGLFAGPIAGGARGFSNTPEGKIITTSFADSFNQMVKALRNYKPQQVEGGLGKGGRLTIGGADDPMPQATNIAPIAPAPLPAPNPVYVEPTPKVVKKPRSQSFYIDDNYDEKALNKYYDWLKNHAPLIAALGSMSTEQMEKAGNGMMNYRTLINMLVSGINSHKIELEAWPLNVRQEAWAVLGKRIESHSTLFEKNRKMALQNEDIDPVFRQELSDIVLLTKESFLAE